jgi:hypothetical protein
MKLKHKKSMNYGNSNYYIYICFEIFIFSSSRAGVPEKYCIDIERKINGPSGLNTETTTNTSVVH